MSNNLQAPWTTKDLSIILIVPIVLFASVFLSFSLSLLPSFSPSLLLLFALQWLILLVPLGVLTHKKYRLKLSHFALNPLPLKTILTKALTAYLFYVLIALIIVTIKEKYQFPIPGFGEQNLFDNQTLQNQTTILFLIIAALAPILEEIFFRGFLLRTLGQKMPLILASLTTALIFSAVHYPWQSFGQILLLGLILNHLTLKTNSILPGIAFHILNNTIAFAILLNL